MERYWAGVLERELLEASPRVRAVNWRVALRIFGRTLPRDTVSKSVAAYCGLPALRAFLGVNGRVALRIFGRIADVLEGTSDLGRDPEQTAFLMTKEKAMWEPPVGPGPPQPTPFRENWKPGSTMALSKGRATKGK